MIVEETGEEPKCPICDAEEHCSHIVANIDRTFLECYDGEFYERESDFRSEIEDAFIKKIKSGSPNEWILDDLNELLRGSLDSYDQDQNYLMLDGIVFYRLVIGMLLEAGAIDHPGQIIDKGGSRMTSAVTLLYAHDPKEVIESAIKSKIMVLKLLRRHRSVII